MTDEQIAQNIIDDACFPNTPGWLSCGQEMKKAMLSAFSTIRKEAIEGEREKCILELCHYCREGEHPLVWDKDMDRWYHSGFHNVVTGGKMACLASAIRSRPQLEASDQ